MSLPLFRIGLPVLQAANAAAVAQSAPPAAARAAASAPSSQPASSAYRSGFADYRAFAEHPLTPWRAANDAVAQIGGWQAHAGDGQGQDSRRRPAPDSRRLPGMKMPIPDSTARILGGEGPFGSVETGGMFSVVKVRRDQPRGDYRDPGWYRHPPGTNAFEWTGALAEPARFASQGGQSMPSKRKQAGAPDIEVEVRKPGGKSGHAQH